jgi:hypothetical protein
MSQFMATSSLYHAHFNLKTVHIHPTPLSNIHLHSIRSNSLQKRIIKTAARDDGDIEVAVFRFTLGIPGFDDALIPRVVGILGAGLLLANHLVSPQPVSDPQTRIEILGGILTAVGIAAPSLQQRLDELRPGKGRKAAAESVSGGTNVFALDTQQLSESIQQNLAWSSYALLKNSNTCGMFVVNKGQVVMCRGILGSSIGGGQPPEVLQRATDAWADIIKKNSNSSGGGSSQQPLVLEDRGAINRVSGLDACKLIPSGVNSVAIIPIQPLTFEENENETGKERTGGVSKNNFESVVVLVSERERALSAKEVRWAEGVASKLSSILT